MSKYQTQERKFQVGITLDQTTVEKIDEASELMRLSRSEAIREAIALYHKRVMANPPKQLDLK